MWQYIVGMVLELEEDVVDRIQRNKHVPESAALMEHYSTDGRDLRTMNLPSMRANE